MKISEVFRYIIGYIIGIALFALLIPYGIYVLSIKANDLIQINILENIYIRVLSGLIFIIGICFVIWSNIYLFIIGKGGPIDGFGITISPRTKHLVTDGPYRYTRNPMVFGAYACYFPLAIFFNSIIMAGILVLFVFISVIYLKNSEEKRLMRDFGEEFIQYRKRVSMIIPLPPKRP